MDRIEREWDVARIGSMTRRYFLGSSLGAMALASMTGQQARSSPLTHHAAKAKRVIYLHMAGSPPQHELFDWKPKLVEYHMKECPASLLEGQRFAFIKGTPKLLGTPFKFAQHGQSGAWVSELLPEFSKVVDEVTFLKGCGPINSITRRRSCCSSRAPRGSAILGWGLGSRMGSGAKTRTCRAMW